MQNFTGTGFSNEEIKKEDIAKQIKSVNDALSSLQDMHMLLLKVSREYIKYGGYLNLDKNISNKAKQEAEKFEDEFLQLKEQVEEYLREMPHD